MEELDELIRVLEISAERNGKDTIITIGHLLNILKMVRRRLIQEDFKNDMYGNVTEIS